MKDNTLSKLGGTCSILLGISYILVAVIYIVMPAEQKEAAGIPPGVFLESLAQKPALFIALSLALALGSLLGVAAAYVSGDATVKAALTVPGALTHLDQEAWLRSGAVGLWILVISLLALRGGTWPKLLAYMGIFVTITYWLIVASNFLQIQSFTTIVAGIGLVVIAPAWYIWLGLRLRKAG